jgi:TPR repeat protein
MVNVDCLYYESHGVETDYKKAFRWYMSAFDLNDDHDGYAFNGLGLLHQNGSGLPKGYSKRIRYFLKSAEKNNGQGFNCLGDTTKRNWCGFGLQRHH